MVAKSDEAPRIFATLGEHPGMSAAACAEKLGLSHELCSKAALVFHRGTDDEKAAVLAGTLSITKVGLAIRKRSKPSETEVLNRKQVRKENGNLYRQFIDAVNALAGLPRPEDMAKIISYLARGSALDNLPAAEKYVAAVRFALEQRKGDKFTEELRGLGNGK